MDPVILTKASWPQFVDALLHDYRVLAPTLCHDEVRFAPVTDAADVRLDYRNTPRPPKAAFFPQAETMIRFERTRDNMNAVRAVPLDETPTVLLGVRPCDARSFLLLDAIFGEGSYLDPYYVARREHTLVVSLACRLPRNTCFCHAFGSGPYDDEGADILMQDAGDAYVLHGVTPQGEALLEGLALPPADEEALTQAAEVREAAQAHLRPIEPVARH